MRPIITIPTEAELRDSLAGLDRLLNAKEWERAAIVYAFTTNEMGRPGKSADVPTFPVPILTFAGMGFQGLRSDRTVRRYRKVWADAIARGTAQEVHPGDEVTLPADAWSEFYDPTEGDARYDMPAADDLRAQAQRDGTGPSKVLDVAKNKAALASAIMADPAVADAAAAALDARAAATRRQREAQLEDIELNTMARGGRIPSLEEVNERRANHPLEAAMRAVDDEMVRLDQPIRRIEAAVAAFTESVGSETSFAERLRKVSFALLDRIVDVKVQS